MQKRKKSHQLRARAAASALIDSLESRLLFTSILPDGFGETLVADGIVSPTSMAFAPDGRLFVCEKSGAVRVIKNGEKLATPFTTVTASTFSERGLGGIAIDPHFEDNGFVYLYYTAETPNAHNRVSRFTITPGGDVAIAGSEQVLLDLPDAGNGTSHNGGSMKFLPDGTLLIGVGDHTNSLNGQDMTTPFGKILRINADGSIPNDNPFYNSSDGILRTIWALGVRNPFTMDVQPGTGRIFINDVGQAEWEEINEGHPGANYGWSETEGAFDPLAHPDFTEPLYVYSHNDGAAVTGGAFYNPTAVQFPAENVGQYFFADFAFGWIKRLNPATKQVTTFATQAYGAVDLDVGPDGSLYWLSRFDDSIYKITATLAPQVSGHPQSQLISLGQPVAFTVGATGANLNYQWQRDGLDIPGANTSAYSIAAATLADSGAHFRCIVSNPQGSTMSNTATLTVTPHQPPVPVILTPLQGTTYRGGMHVSYSGIATDAEDGTLDGSHMTWWIDFHHADHIHPFIAPITGATGGEFDIPTLDHNAANVWYRINLTVTDSDGFMRTTYRDLMPQLATITLQSNYPGLEVALDGQPRQSPIVMTGVVNTTRTLSALPTQTVDGLSYNFLSWSDGGADTHEISFPDTDTTYTANYQPITNYYLSDRDPTAQSGLLPPQRDGNQFGWPISINNVHHARGVGVTAYTDLSYALGGSFSRFMASVGVDDNSGSNGSITFEVWVDGIKRFDSGLMTGDMGEVPIDLDVSGAQTLRLYVSDGGDGPGWDQGDWGDARLVNFSHAAPDVPKLLTAVAPNYNRVQLSWEDRSTDESSFRIERSIDGIEFVEIGSVAAGVTSFVDAYRQPETTHSYRVRARNAIGNSQYTPLASASTPAATLPSPWFETDIGDIKPQLSGSASYDASANGAITVTGAGLGIGTEADAMHFVYQVLAGDGIITARVSDWVGLNFDNATAGLMIRESLAPNSRHAAMLLGAGPSSVSQFDARLVTGGDTWLDFHPYMSVPRWLRLERAGNTFSAFTSDDGVNFTPFGQVDVPMNVSAYVGLAISASSATNTSTAVFDNITIQNPTPVIVDPASVVPADPITGTTAALSALGDDDAGESNLSYTWSAIAKPSGAADPTFTVNGVNAARNTTATFAKAGVYQMRVRISDGSRFVDSVVSVTVAQTLSGVTVSAPTTQVARGASVQLLATALDQFGDVMASQPAAFTWEITEGDGSIDSNGLFTGATLGIATVKASVAGSEAIHASIDLTVIPAAPSVVQQPAAAINPANNVSRLLSVLADSDVTGGESSLTYTWSATSLPAGAIVEFSANGTNATKKAVVRFTRAGSYTLRVAIFDGSLTTTANVDVVVEQIADSIQISPGITQVQPNDSCAYSALVFDQFGKQMANQPAIEWAVTGDGTIDANGVYTAGATQGTYVVSATVPADASGNGEAVVESVEVVVDRTGPEAQWLVTSPPAAGDSDWLFQVAYVDAHGVDVGTLGNDDIVVTAPDGRVYSTQLVSIDDNTNGSPRVATYRLHAINGVFASELRGTWTIATVADGVSDMLGNTTAASVAIGSFDLDIDFAAVAGGGTLVVHGTTAGDAITIDTADGRVRVTLNGQTLAFDAAGITDIQVRGYAGDDTLTVANTDTFINFIGGGGNDTIVAAAGTLSLGDDLGAGGGRVAVHVAAGATLVFTAAQHLAGLTLVGDAAARFDSGMGIDSFVVVVDDLALDSASRLDVGAGALIVQNGDIGTASAGAAYSGVSGLVQSAYNFGDWQGAGITSRYAAASGGLTSLGIGLGTAILGLPEGDSVGEWRGQAVSGNSIIIAYTYAGDANLDGVIDGGDYGIIDNGAQIPDGFGYAAGDLNFDGVIDGGDYGILDNNIQEQGPPLT